MPNENKPSALALRLLEAAYEAVPGTLADKAPLSALERRKAQRIDAELAPLRPELREADEARHNAERALGESCNVEAALRAKAEALDEELHKAKNAILGIHLKAEALAEALRVWGAWYEGLPVTMQSQLAKGHRARGPHFGGRAALAEYEGDA